VLHENERLAKKFELDFEDIKHASGIEYEVRLLYSYDVSYTV